MLLFSRQVSAGSLLHFLFTLTQSVFNFNRSLACAPVVVVGVIFFMPLARLIKY